jgi:inosine/xanthosine triphosphatase
MKVYVASLNPVKMNACRTAFAKLFPQVTIETVGIAADSGVSDQPVTEEETLEGARNRVHYLIKNYRDFDYVVGIEGGVEMKKSATWAFAWMAVSDGIRYSTACTARFPLPEKVTKLLRDGLELGDANDRVFGQHNSKQKGGAIGLLTGEAITRTDLYEPAIMMALIPFLQYNKILYDY